MHSIYHAAHPWSVDHAWQGSKSHHLKFFSRAKKNNDFPFSLWGDIVKAKKGKKDEQKKVGSCHHHVAWTGYQSLEENGSEIFHLDPLASRGSRWRLTHLTYCVGPHKAPSSKWLWTIHTFDLQVTLQHLDSGVWIIKKRQFVHKMFVHDFAAP